MTNIKNEFVVVFFAFTFLSSQVFAAVITDLEAVNSHVGWFDSISWTHGLSDQDFTLGSAASAPYSIELSDDYDRCFAFLPELATIVVGPIDFQDGAGFYSPVSDWRGALGLNAIAGINGDGLSNVRIWSLLGDFNVDNSVFEVSTVPEPASLLLMGMGMVMLGLASRMKNRGGRV